MAMPPLDASLPPSRDTSTGRYSSRPLSRLASRSASVAEVNAMSVKSGTSRKPTTSGEPVASMCRRVGEL